MIQNVTEFFRHNCPTVVKAVRRFDFVLVLFDNGHEFELQRLRLFARNARLNDIRKRSTQTMDREAGLALRRNLHAYL